MAIEIPEQAQVVSDALGDLLGDALIAVYLHGSAVSGGLQPRSDVDLLAVIDVAMTETLRKRLLAELLRISGRHPARPGGPRCVEVMLFQRSELAAPGCPARADFIYGEWLRDAFEAGALPMPVSDPEVTVLLAQARRAARPLLGPVAAELLPDISSDDVRGAMREALPALLESLQGDERNVLLTLARMWYTAATGNFVAKDAAAAWVMPYVPEAVADVLAYARDAYLGGVEDDWRNRQVEARQAASHLRERLMVLLGDG